MYVEGWGGDISCVPVSALKGTGVPELLETIDLTAELADLKTDASVPAAGLVIESSMDTRKGISATLLIKNGTLEIGSFVVAGGSFVPVRYIEDFKGTKIDRAAASMPVVLFGWNEMPASGTAFTIAASKKDAEKMAAEYTAIHRTAKPNIPAAHAPAKIPGSKDEVPQIAIVPLIIKADVIGSLEGVKHELAKISHDRVKLKIVLEGIGEINENDVKTAIGDPTIIVLGFNEAPDKKAQAMIERSPLPLQIKTFTIIYELANYIREVLTAKIPKVYVEEMLGRAKIAAVFSKEKDRQVVGGKVQEGMLETGGAVRIMRRESEIGRGTIRELQQAKKRVQEVREGFEFGTMIECKAELAEGDKIEAVHMIEKK